jgi:glycerol-3-phosphate dehydrogenase
VDESAVELTEREAATEELARRRYDLLVIGGGIIGAAIAAHAARAGLAVALVDRRDFGAGTSSASSKLIHGGLRYLRLGDVRLVREAHHERRALMHVVAPHLVRRLPFLLPVYADGPYGRAALQAGLVLYSALARARLNRLLPPERGREYVPSLRLDGLRSCGLYADAVTHDGRLCLANIRAAADAGATVLNYAEVRELRTLRRRAAGAEVVVDGTAVSVSARAVVNASGPWVDVVRRLEDPSAVPSVRLSKGAHALLELDEPWPAALTILHDKIRVSFALPWQSMLLLGTTDTLHDGEPGAVEATEADVDQILAEAAVAVAPELLRREAVRSTFAGLRVLPRGAGSTARASRETVFVRGPSGMLSVAGGKLTTYRRIALKTLDLLRNDLGLHRLDRRPFALAGAVEPEEGMRRVAGRFPQLAPAVCAHLVHLYGSLAEDVLAPAVADPDLLDPIHPDGPDLAAQALYARDAEWACRSDDVLRRRTTLALRGLADGAAVRRIDELMTARGVEASRAANAQSQPAR